MKKNKFKIGDKVTFLSYEQAKKYLLEKFFFVDYNCYGSISVRYNLDFDTFANNYMISNFSGKKVTIKNYTSKESIYQYKIKEDNFNNSYCDWMFLENYEANIQLEFDF